MTIAFTTCTNNYLAQAKTLADSILKHNRDVTFIYFIIDKPHSDIDYDSLEPCGTVFMRDLVDENLLTKMCKKYNVVELATSIKATAFKYIFNTYTEADKVLFFDPDVKTYEPVTCLENEFADNDILLTPHILSPINTDNKMPYENIFLKFGVFNTGFLGVKRSSVTLSMLDWWENKLHEECFIDTENGLFVDQLCMNFLPVFYPNVKILDNKGYNMGPWNLHERFINEKTGTSYLLNGGSKLMFYHFSSFEIRNKYIFPYYYNRYDFKDRPDLIDLYNDYANDLVKNRVDVYSKMQCAFDLKPYNPAFIVRLLKWLLRKIENKPQYYADNARKIAFNIAVILNVSNACLMG
jgi:lipopolysaccharide biosynthesis glycosyltransferase